MELCAGNSGESGISGRGFRNDPADHRIRGRMTCVWTGPVGAGVFHSGAGQRCGLLRTVLELKAWQDFYRRFHTGDSASKSFHESFRTGRITDVSAGLRP